jgi:HD-GYP domain-containing protein (c-di-GMP phosphodiesterase class II)
MTLDIAANLAQIGKMAIPKEIVAKVGRLTDEENRIMQTHVRHALTILKDIDFDLPVLDTIAQSHERLDGSGYPQGLSGDQLRLEARILAICDVFCARIEERSYRSSLEPEQALVVLEQNSNKYDADIVAELRKVLNAVEGEKLIAAIRRR